MYELIMNKQKEVEKAIYGMGEYILKLKAENDSGPAEKRVFRE